MTGVTGQIKPAGKTILVMAGGTGGHVFPALAVAHRLRQLGWNIEWLGTEQGIEAQVVKQANISLNYIRVAGLRGKGLIRRFIAPFQLVRALLQSLSVVSKIKPACVLGMGGFASGPGGLAAWCLGKPLVIHEQNAIAGMTNRILSRFARRVLTAFPGAFGTKSSVQEYCVGNPLRQAITELPPPAERMQGREGQLRMLILGGSLGAQVLNQRLPQAMALMEPQQRLEIWHQTGKNNSGVVLAEYQQLNVAARVDDFIQNMDEAYAWADLIVCRAGALTVSEIACVGLASILVPYPHAVDDHQTANAGFLESAGAALIIPEPQLTAQHLAEVLIERFSVRSQLLQMAENARQLARLDATDQVANHCLELCHA